MEELRNKMGSYPYLTVTAMDGQGRLLPLGVVSSYDLYKNTLGTVSLRDFCNREETKIPSYSEVISVIDHHKTSLQTLTAPLAHIADAQSSNVLCAELSFTINDAFGVAGNAARGDSGTIKRSDTPPRSLEGKRGCSGSCRGRSSQRDRGAFSSTLPENSSSILHFLFGILDDTDLLSKVSFRDLECVAHLLNRMKSLSLKREVEVVSLEDIPRDEHFTAKAAKRILQNADMYSLYRKIYAAKEEIFEENIVLCAQKGAFDIFCRHKSTKWVCARRASKVIPAQLSGLLKVLPAVARGVA